MCVNLSVSVHVTVSALRGIFIHSTVVPRKSNEIKTQFLSLLYRCTVRSSLCLKQMLQPQCIKRHSIISLLQVDKVRQKGTMAPTTEEINKHLEIKYLGTLQIWPCMICLGLNRKPTAKLRIESRSLGYSARAFSKTQLYIYMCKPLETLSELSLCQLIFT